MHRHGSEFEAVKRMSQSLAASFAKPELTILDLLAMFVVGLLLLAGCQTVEPPKASPQSLPAIVAPAESKPAESPALNERPPWRELDVASARPLDATNAQLSKVELPAPGLRLSPAHP